MSGGEEGSKLARLATRISKSSQEMMHKLKYLRMGQDKPFLQTEALQTEDLQAEALQTQAYTGRLCAHCSRISLDLEYFSTHLNLADLTESAASGCPCCRLFKDACDDVRQDPGTTLPSKITSGSSTQAKCLSKEENRKPARRSRIEIELARNILTYKVFDSSYKYWQPQPYSGSDIVKIFEFCEIGDDLFSRHKSIFRQLLQSDPRSERCFSRILEWLETCENGHPKCKYDDNTQLPHRVIDVSGEIPVLIESHGKRAPYILLSHCWGSKKTLRTTKDTLLAMSQGIPLETLPRTFGDAVTITRKLEIQYLWIDSLCIVQDSEEDWSSEAANMKEYYRNGYLTISALFSPDSHHGFLNTRKDLFSVRLSPEFNLYLRPQLPDYREVFRDAPLNKRAWVLQERLLSTRILHYSDKEMFWECQTCSARESSTLISNTKTEPDTVILSEGEDFKRLLSYLDEPGSALNDALSAWYRLVTNFSRRSITFERDRLAAISGLASLIQTKIGATYLAGIWKEDVRSLVWLRDPPEPSKKAQKDTKMTATELHFPTWSWASASGPVRYRYDEAIPSEFDSSVISCNPDILSAGSSATSTRLGLIVQAKSQLLFYRWDYRGRVELFTEHEVLGLRRINADVYMDLSADDDNLDPKTHQYIRPKRVPHWAKKSGDSEPIVWRSCQALWMVVQKGAPYKIELEEPGPERKEYVNNLLCLLVQRVFVKGVDSSNRSRIRWRRVGAAFMRDRIIPTFISKHNILDTLSLQSDDIEADIVDDGYWSQKEEFEII